MSTESRVFGLGLAYVDAKIFLPDLHLPSRKEDLPAFLDHYPQAQLFPGGSIPNTLEAFAKLSLTQSVRLLSCVGNDPRGKFFTQHLDKKLGLPQVDPNKPTGLWAGVYKEGKIIEFLDYFGAATEFVVDKSELENQGNTLVLTDIDTCSTPKALAQVNRALAYPGQNKTFALSLGGANNRSEAKQTVSEIAKTPDIVFGTVSEVSQVNGQRTVSNLGNVFPNARLIVATDGKQGASVVFEGELFFVPSYPIPENQVKDETGAGDSYMGTMLGLLSDRDYQKWNRANVLDAAIIASFAASLVVQSSHSRLTEHMVSKIMDFSKDFR